MLLKSTLANSLNSKTNKPLRSRSTQRRNKRSFFSERPESYDASHNIDIAVVKGDGIGPEISESVMDVLAKAQARITPHYIEAGESVYLSGISSGITSESMNVIRNTKVLLKGPITTPRGSGYKSLNVTIRKTLGLYANVRPCISYSPYIATKHPTMDVVIIRENEEDLYAGIEHRQTEDVYQCLKIISRPGCERIIRHAFDYAVRNNRKKVSCFVKDNIMKLTDGIFAQVFNEIAPEYPQIETDQWIIDIGTARLADTPEIFDVIVTSNLYGDIISDVAAQITGSVGIGGSANVGEQISMFEAIHGSAPPIAGQNVANPSGLLLAAVQMLVHIGQPDVASRVHNAWLKTLESRIFTPDLADADKNNKDITKVGTKEFGQAVIANLGQMPTQLKPVQYAAITEKARTFKATKQKPQVKKLIGIDIFIGQRVDPNVLGPQLEKLNNEKLKLVMVSNRGVKVYPDGYPETFCTDHWRCRFRNPDGKDVEPQDIINLIQSAVDSGFDFIKCENLYTFDGELGFALGQGE